MREASSIMTLKRSEADQQHGIPDGRTLYDGAQAHSSGVLDRYEQLVGRSDQPSGPKRVCSRNETSLAVAWQLGLPACRYG